MIAPRKLWLIIGLLAAPVGAAAAQESSPAFQALTGNWSRDDGTTHAKIAPCGSNYCAINTWVKNPQGSEHVGDELVLTLAPVSATELKGHAYDVRRKANFAMTITVQNDKMLSTGCVLLGIVCKAAAWSRIN